MAQLSPVELDETWRALSPDERAEGFVLLPRDEAESFLLSLSPHEQEELVWSLPPAERRFWMRILEPDDAADLIQSAPAARREELLALLDESTRTEVKALAAYAEDDAGGLMNPRFARVRPEMTADEAIGYLKRQSRRQVEIIYYAYVLDGAQLLEGVVSFRDLFRAQGDAHVRDLMTTDLVTIDEETDQEEASRRLARHDLLALPVLDAQGHMKGIVTFDDIADVVEEEATEDIQKLGGSEALHGGAPVRRRGARGGRAGDGCGFRAPGRRPRRPWPARPRHPPPPPDRGCSSGCAAGSLGRPDRSRWRDRRP